MWWGVRRRLKQKLVLRSLSVKYDLACVIRRIIEVMLQIFAGLIVFLIVAAANATTYKIRHILVDQPGVIVESSNPNEVLKPGKVYVATFPTGKKCSITLKQQIGGVIILNTSTCKYVQEITKETLIEDSLADR